MTQKKLKGLALAILAAVVIAVVTIGFESKVNVVKADEPEYLWPDGYEWEWDDFGRYFQNPDTGDYYKNGWAQIGYTWYYFDEFGYVSNDFVGGYPADGSFTNKDGEWESYRVDTENVPVYSWHKNDKGWWYGTEDGSMYLKYERDPGAENSWDYSVSDGVYRIDGVTYGFDSQGYLVGAGWQWLDYKDSDGNYYYEWYYANADGSLKTGWQKIDGTWYYFSWPYGRMYAGDSDENTALTSRTQVTDADAEAKNYSYYSFGADGGLIQNGWVYQGKTWLDRDADKYMKLWRYTDSNGSYIWSTWKQINGSWFYFDYWGYMDSSFTSVSGKHINVYREGYYLDDNGVCGSSKYTWHQDGDKWWYGDNGFYEKSAWAIIDNIAYYFGDDGYIVDDLTVNLEEMWSGDTYTYHADIADWAWYLGDGYDVKLVEWYFESLDEEVNAAAVVEEAPVEEAPVEEAPAEEAPAEEVVEEVVEEAPVEEVPVEEVPAE
jgi:hypothetical protein